MKAIIEWSPGELFLLTAYDKDDAPAGAVDIPPALVNGFQRAEFARQDAVAKILAHLHDTGQEFRR